MKRIVSAGARVGGAPLGHGCWVGCLGYHSMIHGGRRGFGIERVCVE